MAIVSGLSIELLGQSQPMPRVSEPSEARLLRHALWMPKVGDMARRSRRISPRDIELSTEPTIINQEAVLVLDGTALVYTEALH